MHLIDQSRSKAALLDFKQVLFSLGNLFDTNIFVLKVRHF